MHHRRFPGLPRLRTDPIWLGPFRIKKVEGREIYIVWNENEFRVEVSQAKPWEGGDPLDQSPPEEEDVPSNIMTSEEMAAEGIYLGGPGVGLQEGRPEIFVFGAVARLSRSDLGAHREFRVLQPPNEGDEGE